MAEGAAAQLAHGVVKGLSGAQAAGRDSGVGDMGYIVCVWLCHLRNLVTLLSHIRYTGPGLAGSYVGQFAECCGYPGGGGVGAHPPAGAGGRVGADAAAAGVPAAFGELADKRPAKPGAGVQDVRGVR